jgi:hypothetical protein
MGCNWGEFGNWEAAGGVFEGKGGNNSHTRRWRMPEFRALFFETLKNECLLGWGEPTTHPRGGTRKRADGSRLCSWGR